MENSSFMPPNQDERTLAMLAHLLQVFSGFLGPLIIYLVKRNQSRFVAFHALQALFWQLAFMVLVGCGSVLIFVTLFATIASTPPPSGALPVAFLLVIGLFYLFVFGGWILTLILGILFAVKANNGEWAGYPVIGQWASRCCGL